MYGRESFLIKDQNPFSNVALYIRIHMSKSYSPKHMINTNLEESPTNYDR